jgi:glutamate-5-semialdehyde dehydrogenase
VDEQTKRTRRIVVKVGTSTLTDERDRLDREYLRSLVGQVAQLRSSGVEVALVSSGAIAAGMEALGLAARPRDLESLQAAASVGQVQIAKVYEELFGELGVTVGQVLLTRHETTHRQQYLYACNTLERLFALGVVPVVNENDTTAVDEITFGDNDALAALVGIMVRADLVVALTDIGGVYTSDPRVDRDAQLVERVDEITDEMIETAGGPGSALGSGGMASKLEAARTLTKAGIPLVVCDGRREGVVADAAAGRSVGTYFEGEPSALKGRKLWIAFGKHASGAIVIDDGAREALVDKGRSLLPAGVTDVRGAFTEGDSVTVEDDVGRVVARGLTELSSADLKRIQGMKSSEVAEVLPQRVGEEVIHRDRLVILWRTGVEGEVGAAQAGAAASASYDIRTRGRQEEPLGVERSNDAEAESAPDAKRPASGRTVAAEESRSAGPGETAPMETSTAADDVPQAAGPQGRGSSMSEVNGLADRAREAASGLAVTSTAQRNRALLAMAAALTARQEEIVAANAEDMAAAREAGTADALLDRLMLDPERIKLMSEALKVLTQLPDPIGEIVEGYRMPNGIWLQKVRVPLGVVAMIYEARPNVTADAAGLCMKTGNAVILRGGSMAMHSNLALTEVLARAAEGAGMPQACIQSVESTERAEAEALMGLHGKIDVLIPRGGAGLIRSVVENAKVPVIETGVGNCHVYVHEKADPEMARRIVVNAKCQRPGVCNAAESLLVDESIHEHVLPPILKELEENGVVVYGDEATRALGAISGVEPASESDWGTEYLDLKIACRVVSGLDEAIRHINTYGTMHSEAIVTEDYEAAMRFLNEVDAAAVYVNASTRFTDGGEFQLGAEIGISTQKLHARGPMGLSALTSTKYVAMGNGQIRG